jgi:exosortase
VVLVVLAYNYSLITLARGLSLQTPLAYLFLVPLIAVVMAAARLRVEPPGLPIHDRQLDWIVGLAMLGIASAILILLPDSTSSTFWLRRVDLLTLPLFVAGLIALFFGVRRVWSLKGPILFLLLAWPVPYSLFLADLTNQFTDVTARLVGSVATAMQVARPSAGDDTLFYIGSGVHAFAVSIGSACAGVNSFVGFLLLGTAMLYLVRGPLVRRGLWLVVGLALVFALNFVRILAILIVGASFGQTAALDILHPVAGLIVFALGMVGMVALVPAFRLRFVHPVPPTSLRRAESPVRRVRPALVVAIAVAAVLGATNATYARFEAISAGLGDARLTSFDARYVQRRSRPALAMPA